jgi:hypothetical protein
MDARVSHRPFPLVIVWATALQAGGHRFDPGTLHLKSPHGESFLFSRIRDIAERVACVSQPELGSMWPRSRPVSRSLPQYRAEVIGIGSVRRPRNLHEDSARFARRPRVLPGLDLP